MKKHITLLLAIVMSSLSILSQGKNKVKLDKKNGIAYINKVEYVNYQKKSMEHTTIYALNDPTKELANIYVKTYLDPDQKGYDGQGNYDDGTVLYYEIHFPGVDDFTESMYPLKWIIRQFYNSSVIVDDELNEEKTKEYIKIYGKENTRRREEIAKAANNNVIIINNGNNANTQPAPQRDGVSIGIKKKGVSIGVRKDL